MSSSRPILAVGAVIENNAGEILLVRRGWPPRENEWSIPGGKVEWGEAVQNALIREVAEETGLDIELAGLIDIVNSFIRDEAGHLTYHHVLLDYAARSRTGTARAGDDVREVKWAPREDLGLYPMWSETRRIILASRHLLKPED
nr:MAG: NUDIX domain-containing protein [Hyphomicrobiales bacterium]